MADGSVRGEFTLTSEQALRGLREIRDTGREADRALENLGRRMDELGRKTVRPRVDLTGIEAANAKLTELEARLDRLSRRSYSPNVGISGTSSTAALARLASAGGGGRGAGEGLVAGGSGTPLFGSIGGMAGRLPWWAMLLPFASQLGGGAGGLISSAGSAALGAGAVGLAGAGSLAAGGGLSLAIARPAIQALGQVTKAQDAYNKAVETFGRQSSQAATAQRNLNGAIAANPAAAGASRQLGLFRSGFASATAPARGAIYGGISNVLYNARVATPTIASSAFGASTATARGATALSGFLAQPAEQGMLAQLTGSFAHNLPIAERSLENVATIFGHLAVDAIPFFTQANLWVEQWTTGLARSSADQPRVQAGMERMVASAKDWARLAAAAGRDIRDLFAPGVQSGNSMVVSLTGTLNRWDTWLRDNPEKVRRFFSDGERGVSRIATVLFNLTKDIAQLFGFLDPILSRAEHFLSFASGIGGGSLLTGGLALYAGFRGARGALGGGGPSAGGLLGSVLLGSPGPALRSGGGVAAVPAAASLSRASNFEVASGRTGAGAILLGGATEGPDAVLARRAAAEADAGAVARLRSLATATPALGRAADVLGGAGRAVAGAARTVAPIMAGLSAIEGISAGASAGGSVPHGINVGVSNALSTLTFGAVKPTTFQQMFGGAATGADDRLSGLSRSFAQQANAVRSPQDLQSLQRRLGGPLQITAEMSPASAAALRRSAQQALQVGAANAGAYASNAWESAFERGLQRGVTPEKAVAQMLRGIPAEISGLGKRGSLAFARDTAQWVSQLEAADPRLIKPLEKLMDGIVADINRMNHTTGESFRELQNKVFYFNGQILQGSQTTWGAIHDALVNPAQKAQEQLSGIWGTIQKEAVDNLTNMGYPRRVATSIVTNLSKGGDWAKIQSTLVQANLSGNFSGFSHLASKPTTLGHARGGVLGGQGLLDTVPMPDGSRAAPGEAWIANRHTMNALSSATIEKYGKTAWEMIRDEGRPHSAPMHQTGGPLGNIAGLVQSAVGGVTNTLGRSSGAGWVSRQHPELHAGIAQAVEDVLSRFPLSITSTTSGGHASGSYHYLGEAADISGDAGTMLRAAGWINSSGLASSLTEGIHNPNLSVKFGRQVSPGYWGAATWGEHLNHIHMAVAGALNATAALGGGGAQLGLPESISLRVPRTPARGIPGAFQQQAALLWTRALEGRVNQVIGAAGISAAGFSGGGSNTANQQLGHRMMLAAGWGEDQWPALQALWNQESGWSSTAVNKSSGAAGIPQALGHGHPFNLGDAPAQIAWGLNYIRGRYGSPAAAEAHERAYNWYQRGGPMMNWAGWNAKGGSFVTRGPTVFGAGERGNKEQVTITPVGQGHGRPIQVIMQNVSLGSGSPQELERVAQDVAGRIIDALDRAEGGATDSSLAGVG